MKLLEANELEFGYQQELVVDRVEVALAPGEFVGLIGPNGSGKTTLLMLLNGILPPRRGQVTFMGRELNSWPRRQLAQKMAMVAQETPVDFPFTVLEVVLMGRYPHLKPLQFEGEADIDIAMNCMELLDIRSLAARPFTALSGGERQRVLVARALCQQPQCLLMDEPTAFLDLRHQIDLFSLTRALVRRQRLGALVTSHDINLAAQFCDRLLLLHRGRLVAQGPPEDVIRPENLEPVYGCSLVVDRSPVGGKPRVTPVPKKLNQEGQPC